MSIFTEHDKPSESMDGLGLGNGARWVYRIEKAAKYFFSCGVSWGSCACAPFCAAGPQRTGPVTAATPLSQHISLLAVGGSQLNLN